MERVSECCGSFAAWVKRKEGLPTLGAPFWGTSYVISIRERAYRLTGRTGKVDNEDSKEPDTELAPGTHYLDDAEDESDEEEREERRKTGEEEGAEEDRKEYDTYISVVYIAISIISLYCLAALDYTSETALGNAIIFPDGYRFGYGSDYVTCYINR